MRWTCRSVDAAQGRWSGFTRTLDSWTGSRLPLAECLCFLWHATSTWDSRTKSKLARKVLQIFGVSHVYVLSSPACRSLRHAVGETVFLRHFPAL